MLVAETLSDTLDGLDLVETVYDRFVDLESIERLPFGALVVGQVLQAIF